MKLEVDGVRLASEIEALASISDALSPAVTRIVFTPTDLKARAWLGTRCEEAGLALRQDPVGNTFARWAGSDPDLPVVGTGSHIDAIPNAGKYDGVVGVLGGLEALRALQRSGFQPRHSLELLIFTSEEPTRFGIGCLGSRMMAGALLPNAARQLKDKDGLSLDHVRASAGLRGDLEEVQLTSGYYKAFIELHIEQGPVLERRQIPLGVVTGIAAPASLNISVAGSGGHAGGVLMPDRNDALCAAADLILAIERAARTSGAIDTVATVGICEVFPGAINSIPAHVRLSVDVRDTDLARRDRVIKEIEAAGQVVSTLRQVLLQTELLNADSPADCAPTVIAALAGACRTHQLDFLSMVSRAYHDSLFMSRIALTGMLFIPCRHGHSHRPDEYASPEDVARGTLVLAEALRALSQ
jgi:ureidoglycolate amidohydrolase